MNKDKRNNIQLLGTLNNADESGIIANANQIYDDVQQKAQETINSELIEAVGTGGSVDSRIASAVATETSRAQEAEANRYTKNETYTKEELNNLITTPNQEYVSITATDHTTAVTDVLPAIGLADTIYRVGSWDGSQYDVTKYSEYAWNGKDYVHLSTKTQIGDVFDISVYHATGGTLATYDNLEDALGTNGKNIPQSLRKGGMSIKFVQSSDNNYVQFRYMSSSTAVADFTNVANWQGVDDVPTVSSNNLVKSGGVYQAFGNVFVISDQLLTGDVTEVTTGYSVGVIKNDGTIAEISGFSYFEIRNSDQNNKPKFVRATFNPQLNTRYANFAVYRVSDDKLIWQTRLSGKQTVAFHPDCYIRICVPDSAPLSYKESFSVQDVESRVQDVESRTLSEFNRPFVYDNKNIIDLVDGESISSLFTANTVLNKDGSIRGEFSGFNTTDYISDISGGFYIKGNFGSLDPKYYCNVAYYDFNNKFLYGLNLNGTQCIFIPQWYKVRICNNDTLFYKSSVVKTSKELFDELFDELSAKLGELSAKSGEELPIAETFLGSYAYTDDKTGKIAIKDNFSAWEVNKFDVANLQAIYVSTKTSGGATHGVIFTDSSDNVLSKLFRGVDGITDTYDDVLVLVPNNAKYCYITTFKSEQIYLMSCKAGSLYNGIEDIWKVLTPASKYVDTLKDEVTKLCALYTPLSVAKAVSNGYIYGNVNDVIGINTTLTEWKHAKYSVANMGSVFDFIAVSCVSSGGATYGCIFTDENDRIISKTLKGTDGVTVTFNKVNVEVPKNAVYCYVTTCVVGGYQLINAYSIENEPVNIHELSDELSDTSLKGKKAVWLGTSIPASGYPNNVASKLEMTIINESKGSSMCRKGRVTKGDAFGDDLGVSGIPWQNIVLSLSMTQEEKLFIFKRWTTENRKALMISEDGYTAEQVANVVGYGNLMYGTFAGEDTEPSGLPANKPIDFMNDVYINARKMCYSTSWNNSINIESGFGTILGKVEKYLNAESFPDYWILDHGHNDCFGADLNDFVTIPSDKFDRSYFIGAMNYIVSKIFSYNPKAKIIVIGHYTNQSGGTNNPVQCVEGQSKFANYWQFPLIKSWELLPFSQAIITTTGYWDANHVWHDTGFNGTNHVGQNHSRINQNPRQVNGIWVHDLTMKQVWMWDDLHPNTDATRELYGKVLANAINNLEKI